MSLEPGGGGRGAGAVTLPAIRARRARVVSAGLSLLSGKDDASMTKGDLVTTMALASGLTKTQAERALLGFLASIRRALARGQAVRLAGFGTFYLSRRNPHRSRNPRTGKLMVLPAVRVPRFRPSRALKQSIR